MNTNIYLSTLRERKRETLRRTRLLGHLLEKYRNLALPFPVERCDAASDHSSIPNTIHQHQSTGEVDDTCSVINKIGEMVVNFRILEYLKYPR